MKWFFKRPTGRRQAFSAGYAGAIIVFFVATLLQSHGQHDNSSVTWGNIGLFLLTMAIFADCCIELYRYFELRNKEPDWSIVIRFGNKEDRDKYWGDVTDKVKETK